ncbi:MAG: DUF502 domain-containing protein [Bacteroidota bacterium]
MNFSQITSRIFSYFVRGLLLLAPVYLTGSILFSVFDKLDQQFYFYFRGTGILILVAIIVLVGFIGTTFIAIPVFKLFEAWMERLPLVRLIYFSLKDLINAFVGDKKKFDRPVLMVLNKENGIHKLGFITQDNLKSLEIENELVTVYCPHSYAFSGETFLVPSQNVTLINASTSEVMKFVVSGGVSTK